MRIREKPLAQNDNVKALTAGAYYCDISTATVRHTVAHCTVRFAQDSPRRYSFTLVSPFLHHFLYSFLLVLLLKTACSE